MIYTLTLNTAIDMNIFSDPLQPDIVNRTRHTEYCPNGKGVNVALVLNHFQRPAHILGIFGGFTGRYIVEELRKKKLAYLLRGSVNQQELIFLLMMVNRSTNWSILVHIFLMTVSSKY